MIFFMNSMEKITLGVYFQPYRTLRGDIIFISVRNLLLIVIRAELKQAQNYFIKIKNKSK